MRKILLTASLSGCLELYDFTLYVFMAPVLAQLFFPNKNANAALLETFAVFAIGYFARPLSAIVFGHYGDKQGRRAGFIITTLLMAVATLCIGLLPSYQRIGILAPVALVLLRFLQGVALGGDLPGAMVYIAEHAPNRLRGFYCSIVFSSANLGVLIASILCSFLSSTLAKAQLLAWGWRIPFISGFFLAIISYYIRKKIKETPYFIALAEARNAIEKFPLRQLVRKHFAILLRAMSIILLLQVAAVQIYLYMPTYFHKTLHISLATAFTLNSINLGLGICIAPLFGLLCDRVGRKNFIITIALLFVMLSYPLYFLLNNAHAIVMIMSLFTLGLLTSAMNGVVPSTWSELFPTPIRYTGMAISYNVVASFFASTVPLIVTHLTGKSAGSAAASYTLIFSASLALIATLSLPEMRGGDLPPV